MGVSLEEKADEAKEETAMDGATDNRETETQSLSKRD